MRMIDADVFKAKVRSKITWLLERGMKVDGEWIWTMVNEILEDANIESEKSEQIGYWINDNKCSICGNDWDDYVSGDIWYDGVPDFCPHCGKRMEETNETD